MLCTLAVAGYRTLRDVVLPLGSPTITGANGVGKSNLYRALRLLQETAHGSSIASLAREGGLASVLWAGPESFGPGVRRGEQAVEGTVHSDDDPIAESVDDAFPGARVELSFTDDGRCGIAFCQRGLLRPLTQAELSDGTLRYLLWIGALLTPRPPSLMVINEPETSLHPDLLPPLGRLIAKVSERCQVWVVTHSAAIRQALERAPDCVSIALEKELGETRVAGQTSVTRPVWAWPPR